MSVAAAGNDQRASASAAPAGSAAARPNQVAPSQASPPLRFYDNRQKYLAFVNTCNEKSAVARRAAHELSHLKPTPPALRFFDAGMGDATVLSRLMRSAHRAFTTVPLLVVTNLNYAEAPRLMPRDVQSTRRLWSPGASRKASRDP